MPVCIVCSVSMFIYVCYCVGPMWCICCHCLYISCILTCIIPDGYIYVVSVDVLHR